MIRELNQYGAWYKISLGLPDSATTTTSLKHRRGYRMQQQQQTSTSSDGVTVQK